MAPESPTGDSLVFELSIWAEGTRYYARVTNSPVGPSKAVPLASFFENRERLETLLLRVENAMLRGGVKVRGALSIEERTLQEFGHSVFDIVFRQAQPIDLALAAIQEEVHTCSLGGVVDCFGRHGPICRSFIHSPDFTTAPRNHGGYTCKGPRGGPTHASSAPVRFSLP